MNKDEWKQKIISASEDAGTYQPFFDSIIDTLSSMLERRDDAEEMFKKSGGHVLVKHINKAGATNLEQNPALRLVNDLNRDALAYWRDLGLTPAGLKKLKDLEIKSTSDMSGLERALNGIARELGQSS